MKRNGIRLVVWVLFGLLFSIFSHAQDLIWTQTSNPSSRSDWPFEVTADTYNLFICRVDNIPGSWEWRIEKRSKADGSLAWAVTENFSPWWDVAESITHDGSYVYVAGVQVIGDYNYRRIEKRRKFDGALVWAVTSDTTSAAKGIVADDSYLYISSYEGSLGPGNTQWLIEKRDKNTGSLVWAAYSNPSSNDDQPFGITQDASYIYITGMDRAIGSADAQWRVEKRRKSDGGLEWAQTSNPSTGSDDYYDISCDNDFLYLNGSDNIPGNYEWWIEKRSKADGSLIWTVTNNPSSSTDEATCCFTSAVDYLYIVGYDASLGNSQWRIEKRNKPAIGIEETRIESPIASLQANPNPFTQKTEISYEIRSVKSDIRSTKSEISVKIYDATGRLVKSFNHLTNYQSSIMWDGTDDFGSQVPAGIYFIMPEGLNVTQLKVVKVR